MQHQGGQVIEEMGIVDEDQETVRPRTCGQRIVYRARQRVGRASASSVHVAKAPSGMTAGNGGGVRGLSTGVRRR